MLPREELVAMELVLLTVPDCPNAAAFEERLAAALAGHPAAVVRRRVVGDEREAARWRPRMLSAATRPWYMATWVNRETPVTSPTAGASPPLDDAHGRGRRRASWPGSGALVVAGVVISMLSGPEVASGAVRRDRHRHGPGW